MICGRIPEILRIRRPFSMGQTLGYTQVIGLVFFFPLWSCLFKTSSHKVFLPNYTIARYFDPMEVLAKGHVMSYEL